MKERRQFFRMRFGSRVQVTHPEHGVAVFQTADVSDGGLYLLNGPYELALGDTITLQVLDLPEEGPVVSVRVVRRDVAGVGLQFAD
jgi:hypothetical protein